MPLRPRHPVWPMAWLPKPENGDVSARRPEPLPAPHLSLRTHSHSHTWRAPSRRQSPAGCGAPPWRLIVGRVVSPGWFCEVSRAGALQVWDPSHTGRVPAGRARRLRRPALAFAAVLLRASRSRPRSGTTYDLVLGAGNRAMKPTPVPVAQPAPAWFWSSSRWSTRPTEPVPCCIHTACTLMGSYAAGLADFLPVAVPGDTRYPMALPYQNPPHHTTSSRGLEQRQVVDLPRRYRYLSVGSASIPPAWFTK